MKETNIRLLQLLADGDWHALREALSRCDLPTLHALIEASPAEAQAILFRLSPHRAAEALFEGFAPPLRRRLLTALAAMAAAGDSPLEAFTPDELDEMPAEAVRLLPEYTAGLAPERRFLLAGYDSECVGRLLSHRYLTLSRDLSAGSAAERLRQTTAASRAELLCVTAPGCRLVGALRPDELLLADPAEPVASLCRPSAAPLHARDTLGEASARMVGQATTALPVTDASGALLGIVTADRLLKALREAGTEDFQKFGGAEELELSYTRTPLLSLVRKRAGWLVILFLSEMLTASAMGYFDDEIARAVVLALFVPLIISSGGNSGSQAASLIIRALALGELGIRQWWYILRKELLSGVLLGAILGCIGLVRIIVWQQAGFFDYGQYWKLLAVTIGAALVGIVTFGSLAGSLMPFVLKRFGFDPASASAPFIATLVDVTGIVIYFSVAWLFLHGTIL